MPKENIIQHLAFAKGIFNPKRNELIKFTIRPSPIKKAFFDLLRSIQPKLNILYYNLSLVVEKFKFDDPLYMYLYNIHKEKQKRGNQKIVASFIRSDYLLNLENQYKQVEINTISQCFLVTGPNVNKIHSAIYPNVEISRSDTKFVEFLCKLRSVFEQKYKYEKTVIAMIDKECDISSTNYLEKVALISLLFERNVEMVYCTLEDLVIKDSNVYFEGKQISIIYYRWFYNYDHFNDQTKKIRRDIELANVINLPSVEYQMINSKCFQVLLSDREFLKEYTEDYRDIIKYFGEFKMSRKELDEDIQKGITTEEDWLAKSMREGGNSVNKEEDFVIYMKKIQSPTTRNKFIGDECERDMINEVSIFGSFIAEEGIIHNEEDGYIIRTKDKSKLEGGICTGNGGLDSAQLID